MISRGRAIRRWRVAGLTASALAAAAVVTAVSLLGLQLPSPAPIAPRPPVVTVVPPGPGAPEGLIASGTVGRERWSARITAPRNGQVCLMAGAAGQVCGIRVRPTAPAELAGGPDAPGYRVLAGPVQPRVTHLELLLADGQRLVLHPVVAYGQRWVAVALPLATQLSRAVAYHGRAEYRYAIPFTGPGPNPFPVLVDWLRPGATGLPRRVYQVAAGTADGHRWSAAEYTGPWGRCLVIAGGSDCIGARSQLIETGQLIQPMFSVPDGVHLGAAARGVASVRLDLSSGLQLRAVTRAGFGGQRFYGFVLPHGTQVAGWTAYGPDGTELGSGPGSTAG